MGTEERLIHRTDSTDDGSEADGSVARYWHAMGDGRIQCDLCPRFCRLHDGQRGLCFVRARDGDRLVLTTYGRSSGFEGHATWLRIRKAIEELQRARPRDGMRH